MDLIERLQQAVADKNKSQLEAFEIQAKAEVEPLLANGQKNHAAIVLGLLEIIRALPVYARHPEDFALRVSIPTGEVV